MSRRARILRRNRRRAREEARRSPFAALARAVHVETDAPPASPRPGFVRLVRDCERASRASRAPRMPILAHRAYDLLQRFYSGTLPPHVVVDA